MKRYSEILTKANFLKFIDEINYVILLEDTTGVDNFEKLTTQIQILKSLISSENTLEQILRDFTETRNNLINLFIKYNSEDNTSDSSCPVCGYDWPDGYTELMMSIEEKSKEIKRLQSKNSIELDKQYDLIYRSSIEPLLNVAISYLNNDLNIIDPRYQNKLDLNDESRNELFFLLDWLKSKSIDISQNCFSELNILPEDIAPNILNIQNLIQSQKMVVDEFFDSLKFSVFLKEVLSDDENNIEKLHLDDIRLKISYIDQEFFKSNDEQIDILKKELEFITEIQIKKLSEAYNNTSTIINLYSEEIKLHRRKIAKSIELPFYVISGKILQNYELGSGLFIKMNQSEKTENLKFTQSVNTSHDALYSMSSGQLSALIMSFTLAMNKVFDKSNFGVLLIDDPTQTMDEINMASLVDLLRSEFADKQIILSTHEDEISYFMRFKFDAFEKRTIPINMKDKQYQLSK